MLAHVKGSELIFIKKDINIQQSITDFSGYFSLDSLAGQFYLPAACLSQLPKPSVGIYIISENKCFTNSQFLANTTK